jgi:hypothetical protein
MVVSSKQRLFLVHVHHAMVVVLSWLRLQKVPVPNLLAGNHNHNTWIQLDGESSKWRQLSVEPTEQTKDVIKNSNELCKLEPH